jgi:hypothetical protein
MAGGVFWQRPLLEFVARVAAKEEKSRPDGLLCVCWIPPDDLCVPAHTLTLWEPSATEQQWLKPYRDQFHAPPEEAAAALTMLASGHFLRHTVSRVTGGKMCSITEYE